MNRKISCTCTIGESSERHNHDLDYRQTLKHVHGSAADVIELIPYRSYREQINDLMKPHIDEYNERQQQRYQEAWERYNNGEIKTKPRKRDYCALGYDYYADHINDIHYNRAKKKNETRPLWRGLIYGLGDKDDRQNNRITREEAIAVMRRLVDRWHNLFPAFILLGATIHMDESGFYHCHIDYFPFSKKPKTEKQEQGIRVSHSQEAALERMGFEPEQSIINQSDKVPIRFNAFRNRIYMETEVAMADHGIRLEYGVSKRKEPEKDSSINQQLQAWQDTQDGLIKLQQMKNHMLDIVEGDDVSPEELKKAISATHDMERLLGEVAQQPRSRTNKNNVVVHFTLFDQIKSVIENIVNTVVHLLNRITLLTDALFDEKDKAEELEEELRKRDATIERYKQSNHDLQGKVNKYSDAYIENEARKRFMSQYKINDVPMEQKFRESLFRGREK